MLRGGFKKKYNFLQAFAVNRALFVGALLVTYLPQAFASQHLSNVASPDLNYDALPFQVGELDPQSPSGECEFLEEDIVGFKTLNKQNYESILTYINGVSGVAKKWESLLTVYAGQTLNFAPSTFAPIKDLIENLEEVAKLIETNSILVDDYAYEFSESLLECTGDEEISLNFEQYSVDLFSTQSEVWRYIADSSLLLNLMYDRFSMYEGHVPVYLAQNEFERLQKISSSESGSSGFGEMGSLYKLVMNYYENRFAKIEKQIIEKQISEDLDVKSSRIH